MGDTSRSQTISTELQQIAQQAVYYPDSVFSTLAHKIDVPFLHEAYRRTRKSSAPGSDKVTASKYAENLVGNLIDLHRRLKDGRYHAPPVLRVWIEKEDGKERPIGIPAFEDKIVQRAVEMLINQIYEIYSMVFPWDSEKDGVSIRQFTTYVNHACGLTSTG